MAKLCLVIGLLPIFLSAVPSGVFGKSALPDSVDWRKQGYVTEVPNQGSCAGSTIYSILGSLEGRHKKATGKLVPLSVQNVIDCMPGACSQPDRTSILHFITNEGGIDSAQSYPYSPEHKCRFSKDPKDIGATVSGYILVEARESALKKAVATEGPISVAVHATNAFSTYSSGVFYDPSCSSKQEDLNHAMLLVGYGSSDGIDYWIVRNSWGANWGEEGYIRMARNKNNNCGIATQAIYPLL